MRMIPEIVFFQVQKEDSGEKCLLIMKLISRLVIGCSGCENI
jgi:hypothetical protein